MRKGLWGIGLALFLFVALFVSVSGQVDVSNFGNIRTDGFVRTDTYVRVGTFLAVDPATVITFTSGTFTPGGSNQKIAITAARAITTIAAPAQDGTIVNIQNISNQTLTFTETVGNLVLGGTTRALGQTDNITVKWDTTLNKWYEIAFTNN